jgi:DNA-binding Lrp family transcriptional regulator
VESVALDELDRALVHALQCDGRAPFGRIGEVLGVSDHTVARRYRRLRAAGVLRVVALPQSSPLGRTDWFLRLRCLPDAAAPIARSLARREDVSWVMLTSAGTEITCLMQVRSRPDRDGLLLGTLPRTRHVVEVDALCVLATFAGGATGWNGRGGALTEEQVTALTPAQRPDERQHVALDDADAALLSALRRDARTPIADLAHGMGVSASAMSRRLERLLALGALAFDVEIAPEHLGYDVEALLWVTVAPGLLDATARAVAGHAPVAFAAATSGTANLVLATGFHDVPDLYAYLARELGPMTAVTAVHTAPVISTIKRAGTLLD